MSKTVASDVYQDQVATFIPVTGATTVKLGSIVPESNDTTPVSANNFSMQLVGTDGNPMKVSACKLITDLPDGADIVEKYGTKEVIFVYYPDAVGTKPAGWYLQCDKKTSRGGMLYQLNDIDFPVSQGVTVYAGSTLEAGAKLTYNGQVDDEDYPFEVGSDEFGGSGNVAPKDMALSEFVPVSKDSTPVSANNFSFQICGTDGNPMKVSACPMIQALPNGAEIIEKYGTKEVIFVYYPDAVGTKPAGWYLQCDKKTSRGGMLYNLNDLVLPAGQGFAVYAGSTLESGAQFILPNALN